MMAIVIAGGSVAACAETAAPGDAEGTAPAQSKDTTFNPALALPLRQVTAPPLAAPSDDDPPPHGIVIPPCNANPDPCCRNPDLPGCSRDAGGDDAADAGVDAGEDAEDEASCGSSSGS